MKQQAKREGTRAPESEKDNEMSARGKKNEGKEKENRGNREMEKVVSERENNASVSSKKKEGRKEEN